MHPTSYPSSARALEQEFFEIAKDLDGDVPGRRAGADYLMGTRATYHGNPLTWDMMPKILDDAALSHVKEAAETMSSIMEKTTRRCLEDPKMLARFGFSENLERMVKAPTGYDQMFPIARVDIFLDEDTGAYKFCEVNTDGSAGMTTSQEIPRAIAKSETYRRFARRHPDIETFDIIGACGDALLDTFASWARSVDAPKADGTAASWSADNERGAEAGGRHDAASTLPPEIVICDFDESASHEEVADFIDWFKAHGVDARFSDVRTLHVQDVDGRARLCDDQGPTWCVWRRAVTSEMDEKWCAGTDALVTAQEQNLACVMGGCRTWICATKTFFALVHEPQAAEYLSPEEVAFVKEHVPETFILDPSSDLSAFSEKDRWIVKPAGGYNSVGVAAGLDCTQDEWERALADIARQGGIVQAYAPQYATPTLRGDMDGTFDVHAYPEANNMEGLFLFNGKFGGMFPRCGYGNVIGEFQGRLNQGAFVVHE
jgi:hypothetical protein